MKRFILFSLVVCLAVPALALNVAQSFSSTGTMTTTRTNHTSTLLPNGKVLVTGGFNGSYLSSAEIYDPLTKTWSATASLSVPRELHTATLLPNGKVLIAGGHSTGGNYPATAELYDPASGTFSPAGSMVTPHASHTATLLPNGKVLLAGGYADGYWDTAELYDPSTNTFTATGSMKSPRGNHTATLLANGRVLIAAGSFGYINAAPLGSAEIYDPAAGTFTLTTGILGTARYSHTATLLTNGKVLITGGTAGNGGIVGCELFDPSTGTFSPTGPMANARDSHVAMLLPDGKVLVAGGYNFTTFYVGPGETYDPDTGTFTTISSMNTGRSHLSATMLANGEILLAGGFTLNDRTATAEIFTNPNAIPAFQSSESVVIARTHHTATTLPNGDAVLIGGNTSDGRAELIQFEKTSMAQAMITPRHSHTATLLPNGKVLVTGGSNGTTELDSAELFDPSTGFTATGKMAYRRQRHTATLLPNGQVLIAGGWYTDNGNQQYVPLAELYDPSTGKFTTLKDGMARAKHTATLLPNGKVLIAGGEPALYPAYVFDPNTNAFTNIGYTAATHYDHTATLLPNGKVLIAGGQPDGKSSELYDPETGTFTPIGNLYYEHVGHTATVLRNDRVLIVGGYNVAGNDCTSAELYDPATNSYVTAYSLLDRRAYHTAALLPHGYLHISGGEASPSVGKTTAEVFSMGGSTQPARTAVIASAPATLTPPATLTLTGTAMTSFSEGASGGTNSSASNAPLLRLQRIENEQITLVSPSSFNATSYSAAIGNLPAGAYRATIVTNGIPSFDSIIRVVPATPVITSISPAAGSVNGGTTVTITGQNLMTGSVSFGGVLAYVISASPTSLTIYTPQHMPGLIDVIVTNDRGLSRTAFNAFTYQMAPPPWVTANANSPTSVTVTWPWVPGATTYEVRRTADGVNFTTFTVGGTTLKMRSNTMVGGGNIDYTDVTASPNTAYLYTVRVTGPTTTADAPSALVTTILFTDDPIGIATKIKAVHFTELRTAVNAVRKLAGLAPATFTDPTITPGVTRPKAVHLTELRAALDAARAQLALPAVSYARMNVVGQKVKANDLYEVRIGTQRRYTVAD